jgi:hypothetical protein
MIIRFACVFLILLFASVHDGVARHPDAISRIASTDETGECYGKTMLWVFNVHRFEEQATASGLAIASNRSYLKADSK